MLSIVTILRQAPQTWSISFARMNRTYSPGIRNQNCEKGTKQKLIKSLPCNPQWVMSGSGYPMLPYYFAEKDLSTRFRSCRKDIQQDTKHIKKKYGLLFSEFNYSPVHLRSHNFPSLREEHCFVTITLQCSTPDSLSCNFALSPCMERTWALSLSLRGNGRVPIAWERSHQATSHQYASFFVCAP
jgi:hypothetical protein